jgi:hypothetical protein
LTDLLFMMSGSQQRRRRQISVSVAKKTWAWRRGLAPFFFVLLLWAAGALAHAIPSGAVQTTVAVMLVLGGAMWWGLEKAKSTRNASTYAWLLYLCSSVWLASAAAVGAGPPMPGFLLLGFLPFAIPWWIHHRIRRKSRTGDELRIWEEMVACPGGALPGSRLINIRHTDRGWTADVLLPGGAIDNETAVSARKRIASAYASAYGDAQKVSISAVTLEAADDDRADLMKLAVFKKNPTHETSLYDPETHFELVEGCVPLMSYPDGTRAYARIFKEGSGPTHVIIAGSTGSGKSRTIDLFLTQSNLTGLVHTWFIDPQNGASSAAWANAKKGQARWRGHTEFQYREMLAAARRVMQYREGVNTSMTWVNEDGEEEIGVDFFEPSPERPILQLVIEEAYNLLEDKELAKIINDLARMARKCGVQLVLIVQWPGLDQLGNSNALREQLKNGTIVCMKISDAEAGDLLLPPHIKKHANPAKMPKRFPNGQTTEGLAVMDSSAPNSSRAIFGRMFLQAREVVKDGKKVYASMSAKWARYAAQYSPPLEPGAVDAAGPYYQHFLEHGWWPEGRLGKTQGPSMTKETPTTAPVPVRGSQFTDKSLPIRDRIIAFLQDPEVIKTKSVAGGFVQLNLVADGVGLISQKPNVTYHLNQLKDAGVVEPDGKGRWRFVGSDVLV